MPRNKRYTPIGVSNSKNTGSALTGKFRDQTYAMDRYGKSKGRLFPTFSHTRTSEKITTFSDVDYLVMALVSVDHATANSKTAFKNLLIAMYKEGHTSGNMKDIVTTEETAFSVVGLDSFIVLFDLILQLALQELLANPAESDTNAKAYNRPAQVTYNSMMLEIQNMEAKGLWVPECIRTLLKDLLFLVKIQAEYSVGAKVLPPRYFLPYCPSLVLADIQSFVTEWAQNCAQAKLHMDKFGIKYKAFTVSDIFSLPEKSPNDPTVMAYFNHVPPLIYDAGPTARRLYPYTSIAGTTTWTACTYYFYDKPDEAPFHAFLPFFNVYHATNNPYGGILSDIIANAAQDYVSLATSNYDNTGTWTATVANVSDIFIQYLGVWKQTDNLNVSLTGGYKSADYDFDYWLLVSMNGARKASGLTKTSIEDILKTYFIISSYGGSSSRGSVPRKKKGGIVDVGD